MEGRTPSHPEDDHGPPFPSSPRLECRRPEDRTSSTRGGRKQQQAAPTSSSSRSSRSSRSARQGHRTPRWRHRRRLPACRSCPRLDPASTALTVCPRHWPRASQPLQYALHACNSIKAPAVSKHFEAAVWRTQTTAASTGRKHRQQQECTSTKLIRSRCTICSRQIPQLKSCFTGGSAAISKLYSAPSSSLREAQCSPATCTPPAFCPATTIYRKHLAVQ